MIRIYYHVYGINNVDEIVDEQLSLLNAIKEPFKLTVGLSVSNESYNNDNLLDKINPNIIKYNENEFLTLNLIQQDDIKDDDYILYLHTKGVKHNNNNVNVNDWIDYLTYFNITKYETCINYLQDYDAVGVNLQTNNVETHYSGNFWWTKSQYIKKLTKCEYKNYNSPEFWLTETNTGKYLSLCDSNINHYSQRYEEHNYKK